MPGASTNALRMSEEKTPMPHGRGGKVDRIALRTAAPFHREIGIRHAGISSARICRVAPILAAALKPSDPARTRPRRLGTERRDAGAGPADSRRMRPGRCRATPRGLADVPVRRRNARGSGPPQALAHRPLARARSSTRAEPDRTGDVGELIGIVREAPQERPDAAGGAEAVERAACVAGCVRFVDQQAVVCARTCPSAGRTPRRGSARRLQASG